MDSDVNMMDINQWIEMIDADLETSSVFSARDVQMHDVDV